jgi:hypothetical protein
MSLSAAEPIDDAPPIPQAIRETSHAGITSRTSFILAPVRTPRERCPMCS